MGSIWGIFGEPKAQSGALHEERGIHFRRRELYAHKREPAAIPRNQYAPVAQRRMHLSRLMLKYHYSVHVRRDFGFLLVKKPKPTLNMQSSVKDMFSASSCFLACCRCHGTRAIEAVCEGDYRLGFSRNTRRTKSFRAACKQA
jgi:hypothetical protein